MQLALLERMTCPYCGGPFRLRRSVAGDGERVQYGLLECRCFVFPIVDGILLLNLAKGYGGAEEALQAYVPLLAAAVRHLELHDVEGLRAWIRRHIPLVGDLIDGTDESYLDFSTRLGRALDREADAYLNALGQYEVLGVPRPAWRRAVHGAVSTARRWRAAATAPPLPTAADYYQARFFAPRVNAMALQLTALPDARRLLSLCCGHGVFESLLRARGYEGAAVSLDGQLLNVLITRHYADHGGTYICHDVQFPLPFRDAAFDGVFSSTCLPEIPSQQTFAGEAVRVTASHGWTDFDSIWNTEVGPPRIDPTRHYRFCQNFFARLEDYVPMLASRAGPDRRIGIDVPDAPAGYLDGPGWVFGSEIDLVLARRADVEISALVLGPGFPGFVAPDTAWLRPGNMAASLAFVAERRGERIELHRRPEFAELRPEFASRQFPGYPEKATIDLNKLADPAYLTTLYTEALVSVVPDAFTGDPGRRLAHAEPRTSDIPSPQAGGAGAA